MTCIRRVDLTTTWNFLQNLKTTWSFLRDSKTDWSFLRVDHPHRRLFGGYFWPAIFIFAYVRGTTVEQRPFFFFFRSGSSAYHVRWVEICGYPSPLLCFGGQKNLIHSIRHKNWLLLILTLQTIVRCERVSMKPILRNANFDLLFDLRGQFHTDHR